MIIKRFTKCAVALVLMASMLGFTACAPKTGATFEKPEKAVDLVITENADISGFTVAFSPDTQWSDYERQYGSMPEEGRVVYSSSSHFQDFFIVVGDETPDLEIGKTYVGTIKKCKGSGCGIHVTVTNVKEV